MGAQTDGERLAVLETKVDTMQDDITEIKGDVKRLAGVVDAMVVVNAKTAKDQARFGVWVRALLPYIIGIIGAALAAAGIFEVLTH